ncbi:MAG: phage tail tube protein [Desulfobacteraceae bacterium]|jgi:hypothetical protein
MTANVKIDSNITELRYAEETSIGVLPGTPVWIPMEPNSYNDFGGQITTVARNPINSSRQRKKGVVTDLEASGGINTDLTQTNLQDLLQGFFFASLRKKGECKNAIGVTTITISAAASGSTFTRVGGTTDLSGQFTVGDIVFIAGFSNAANNGIFKVATVSTTTITVTAADGADTAVVLVDEAATSNASIVQVGFESDQGDIDVDMTGSRPALTSTSLDFTDLGLVVGEFVFVGGDETATQFANATNNGFARVRSIAADRLEFDKTQGTMVTEANTTLYVQIFFGRVLKNEQAASILRRTYQLERTLGKADTGDTYDQREYLVGSVPNELTLNVSQADKVTVDISFVSTNNEQYDGDTAPKTGTRPSLVEADAFNTSSDFSRIKLAVHSESDAAPTALFAYSSELTLTINNNLDPNKAIGVLGAFDVSAGTFEVGGSITAYFANVASVQAVRNNADITIDMHLVKSNAGISIDLPLITLGDGRPNVEQDSPITLPLTNEAATGAKIDSNMDHTLLMVFWDYLPSAADL